MGGGPILKLNKKNRAHAVDSAYLPGIATKAQESSLEKNKVHERQTEIQTKTKKTRERERVTDRHTNKQRERTRAKQSLTTAERADLRRFGSV